MIEADSFLKPAVEAGYFLVMGPNSLPTWVGCTSTIFSLVVNQQQALTDMLDP